MIKTKIKFDDKKIVKPYINQSAELFIGYTRNKMYEAIDEPFYANVPKRNTLTLSNSVGKPRRYGKREAVSAAQVAAFNEFGGGHTPPRPFISYTVKKYAHKWFSYFDKNWLQFPRVEQTMWKLGDIVKGDLSQTVISWSQPPNAPSTVKNKGFNNPLVDSGNMSNDFIEIQINGRSAEE